MESEVFNIDMPYMPIAMGVQFLRWLRHWNLKNMTETNGVKMPRSVDARGAQPTSRGRIRYRAFTTQ
ncbi:hypothetical protein [Burkholderia pseudomultivorans]|uniref:hypothetical protein n=1 Tax=Burkholderia pseudomultivorans TaxID=1207504 RepID=UPI0018C528F2|nr:hypothetical protein [Burkholderia pseudomultivorans]